MSLAHRSNLFHGARLLGSNPHCPKDALPACDHSAIIGLVFRDYYYEAPFALALFLVERRQSLRVLNRYTERYCFEVPKEDAAPWACKIPALPIEEPVPNQLACVF